MKLITDKFFDNPSSIEKIWDKPSQELHGIQPMTNFTAQEDFLDNVDEGWANDYPEWLELYNIGMSYRQYIFDNYDVDPEQFHDWWCIANTDNWDRENYPSMPRENSDIHLDIYPDYTKVINLQIYMSKNIPPEAGTCFWEYNGTDEVNHAGPWTQDPKNWRRVDQLPFEYNTAFSYDAGPNGEFHSAPLTHELLDLGVPNHTRQVIIMRYRFK